MIIMHSRIILFFLLLLPVAVGAQREAKVHGTSVYMVHDNDHITLHDAKMKCIEKAKADAVKAEFGENVYTDVVDMNVESDGSTVNSYYWENTAASAKGEWLGDEKEPQINVEYKDGNLIFSAEVWGIAREIVQSKIDLDMNIMKDVNGKKKTVTSYENGEQLFMQFRAPADGYLAVYLTVGNGKTFCLLPYPKDTDGRFPIKNGKDYDLFDRETDAYAPRYNLTTKHAKEVNQLVVIYSPNAFTKCNDKSIDNKRPNFINTSDFEKWLMNCQRNDSEMVVNKKYIVIHNSKAENY